MKRIFILYPHYWPDFSAGGPVQSLFNLVEFFSDKSDFHLISKIQNTDNKVFNLNNWNKGKHGENVYITNTLSYFLVIRLLFKVKPDVIFINGIFTAVTTIPGILYGAITGTDMIISPRGMFQNWALQKKSFKKKIYLKLFRSLMPKHSQWHATSEQEAKEIRLQFGKDVPIWIAPNIPRKPVTVSSVKPRIEGDTLKIIFLSLINSNKNLEMVIDAIKSLKMNISLDIYGHIADEQYWKSCKSKINGLSNIMYKGAVDSDQVQNIMSRYHFFILPTMGENFGHAIFDALSVGLPVIISKKTPWDNVEEFGAGFYCDEVSTTELVHLLEKMESLSTEQHSNLCIGALNYAWNYVHSRNYESEYRFLID